MIKVKVLSILVLFCLSAIPGISQNEKSQEIIISIGESSFELDEFDYYFLKNTDRPPAAEAKSAVNEYLDLFVNFKLKVEEAIDLKMDQDPAFIQEFNGYRDQLIEPFLSTTKVNEDLVLEAYERLQYEVSGSHILIKPKSSKPADTLAAYNEILGYKQRIENGEDFAKVAKEHSHDRSAQRNGGYLGYFTAMQMVYPFENAAYSAEIGELVGPFKTRFGYHILSLNDKRPARGQAKVAHIMIRFEQDSASQVRAEKKVNSIYTSLEKGGDWAELCETYSDDKNTSKNNGELKWFSTGQLVPEFEDVAFAMDSLGSISKPVKTRFGWHIIKLLDKKPLPTFEEQRVDIEKRISKDTRTAVKKSTAISLIKSKYEYKADSMNWKKATDKFDSTLLSASWQIDSTSELMDSTLFVLKNRKYTVGDFWEYVLKNQKKRNTTSLSEHVDHLYNQFEETSIFDYETEIIRDTNTEYRMILDEYKSGILLFNLMEKNVWNKAITDTTGLKQYFEDNKNDYQMDAHLEVRKLTLADSTQLPSLQSSLALSNSQLDSMFNSVEPLTLQIEEKKIFKGDSEFLDDKWMLGMHVERSESSYILWSVKEVKTKGYKKFDDIKGTVISDYQKELEEEWIKELKKKFPVKINKPVVKKYIKSFE